MNCCNAYGECKRGPGCPVGDIKTPEEIRYQLDELADPLHLSPVQWMLVLCIGFVLAAVLGFNLGYWLHA